MTRAVRSIAASLSLAALGTVPSAPAQNLTGTADDPHHSVVQLPLVLRLDGEDRVQVTKNRPYATVPEGDLAYDVYLPPDLDPAEPAPVVVFVNGAGDRDGRRLKEWPVYESWLRTTAAFGLPAVMYDARFGRTEEDMEAFFEAFRRDAPGLGLDPERIGLWSCSSNVRVGFPFAMAPARDYLKAAVFYYGAPETTGVSFRDDLPFQIVLAGRDNAALNERIRTIAGRAVAAGAPLHFVSYADGRHAFDVLDDTDESRYVIRQTFGFLKLYLEGAAGEPAFPPTTAKTALGFHFAREWPEAKLAYAEHVRLHPRDGLAWFRLGSAQFELDELVDAAVSFGNAAAHGYSAAAAFYNQACAFARTGDADLALAGLESAFQAGFADNAQPRMDPDLAILREDPRLRSILDSHTTAPTTVVAPASEPGERIRVRGVVRDPKGKPIANALVFVHHTDTTGYYASNHGPDPRLFGSMRTRPDGSYEYETIRPAAYPDNDIPQHVHYRALAPGYREVIFELLFADDPLFRSGGGQDIVGRPGPPDENGVRLVECSFVLQP